MKYAVSLLLMLLLPSFPGKTRFSKGHDLAFKIAAEGK
jgi:hypothetical protein